MNPVATPADLTRSDARATAADLSVAVVGMGYVGLPTALALARRRPPRHRRRHLRAPPRRHPPPATRSCSTTSRPSSPARSTPRASRSRPTRPTLAAADAVIICRPDAGGRATASRTCARSAAPATRSSSTPARARRIILTSTTYVGTTRGPARRAARPPRPDRRRGRLRRVRPRAHRPGQRPTPSRHAARRRRRHRACAEAAARVLARTPPGVHRSRSPRRPRWRSSWRTRSARSTSRSPTRWPRPPRHLRPRPDRGHRRRGDQAVRLHGRSTPARASAGTASRATRTTCSSRCAQRRAHAGDRAGDGAASPSARGRGRRARERSPRSPARRRRACSWSASPTSRASRTSASRRPWRSSRDSTGAARTVAYHDPLSRAAAPARVRAPSPSYDLVDRLVHPGRPRAGRSVARRSTPRAGRRRQGPGSTRCELARCDDDARASAPRTARSSPRSRDLEHGATLSAQVAAARRPHPAAAPAPTADPQRYSPRGRRRHLPVAVSSASSSTRRRSSRCSRSIRSSASTASSSAATSSRASCSRSSTGPRKHAGLEPRVAIVMPAFNEEAAIAASLRSLLALDYPAGQARDRRVNDGSTDGTLREMRTVAAHAGGRVAGHRLPREPRQARRDGRRASARPTPRSSRSSTPTACSSPTRCASSSRASPMRRVGAVCGHADVLNSARHWLTQDAGGPLLRRLQGRARRPSRCSARSPAARAASPPTGARRSCRTSSGGRTRRSSGVESTFGDDRSLTNCVLRDWKVRYESKAVSTRSCRTTFQQFMKQQLRWKRSWTRESLIVARFIWRKHPLAALVDLRRDRAAADRADRRAPRDARRCRSSRRAARR